MAEQPKAYRVTEAARLIGVSPKTLRKMAKDGMIASRTVYRQLIIPAWAIDQFLGTPAKTTDWDQLLEGHNGTD